MIDKIIITKDKKIENIVLKFDENIQKLFSKTTPRESSDTEDSRLTTKEITNYYPSFVIRFSLDYSKFIEQEKPSTFQSRVSLVYAKGHIHPSDYISVYEFYTKEKSAPYRKD